MYYDNKTFKKKILNFNFEIQGCSVSLLSNPCMKSYSVSNIARARSLGHWYSNILC